MNNLPDNIIKGIDQFAKDFALMVDRVLAAAREAGKMIASLPATIRTHAKTLGYDLSAFSDAEILQAAMVAYNINPLVTRSDKDALVRAIYKQLAAKGSYQ